MRTYFPATYWIAKYAGYRALILESPHGKRIMIKKNDPVPHGRWALIGTIE